MADKNLRFLKVGLTGSLGSGKSEVRKIFASLGAFTIDADLIARELTEPGEAAYKKVVEYWGKAVLNADGSLNRKALADEAFSNAEHTQRLDEIFHPHIIEKEDKLAADYISKSDAGIIVTEAALMIETGSWKRFDKIVLVSCAETIRRERMAKTRNMDSGMFDLISGRQMPDEEKRKLADYIIENSGTPDDLRMQTNRIYYTLLDDLQEKSGRG
jgi:dephospho-CoA kinase